MRNSFLPYFIHACTVNDKKKNYPVATLALIPLCKSVRKCLFSHCLPQWRKRISRNADV